MERERDKTRSKGKLVGRVDDLAHGMTKKFTLRCRDATVEALLLNFEGKLFAYVNRCRHISISMDWVDNRFFTEDKRYLICANHGATYEPMTGQCIWGPCFGARLEAVPLEIRGEDVFAFCPEPDEANAP